MGVRPRGSIPFDSYLLNPPWNPIIPEMQIAGAVILHSELLWRPRYETQIVRDDHASFELQGESLSGSAWQVAEKRMTLIAFRPEQVLSFEIWRRLIEKDFGAVSWWEQGLMTEDPATTGQLKDLIPGSQHKRTFVWKGSAPPFVDRANPVAWLPIARTFVIGAPTEDAWEQIAHELKESP